MIVTLVEGARPERALEAGRMNRERCMWTIMGFIKDDSGASAVDYGLIAIAAGLAISAVMPIFQNS